MLSFLSLQREKTVIQIKVLHEHLRWNKYSIFGLKLIEAFRTQNGFCILSESCENYFLIVGFSYVEVGFSSSKGK